VRKRVYSHANLEKKKGCVGETATIKSIKIIKVWRFEGLVHSKHFKIKFK